MINNAKELHFDSIARKKYRHHRKTETKQQEQKKEGKAETT
jgi:hypothetical protein